MLTIFIIIFCMLAVLSLLCVWIFGAWLLFKISSTVPDETTNEGGLEMQSIPADKGNASIEIRHN